MPDALEGWDDPNGEWEACTVLEAWFHNNWEPWVIIVTDTPQTLMNAIADGLWTLQPLRFRLGCVADWGGLKACATRMLRVFDNRNN